jgi:triosephosphate isomerase
VALCSPCHCPHHRKTWRKGLVVIFNFQNNGKQIEESYTMEELKGKGFLKEKDKQVIIICPSFTFSSLQHQNFPT